MENGVVEIKLWSMEIQSTKEKESLLSKNVQSFYGRNPRVCFDSKGWVGFVFKGVMDDI